MVGPQALCSMVQSTSVPNAFHGLQIGLVAVRGDLEPGLARRSMSCPERSA
jgi:hypothetical protein